MSEDWPPSWMSFTTIWDPKGTTSESSDTTLPTAIELHGEMPSTLTDLIVMKCDASSSKTLSTGLLSFISTGCVSTPYTLSSTTRPGRSWQNSRRQSTAEVRNCTDTY